MSEHLIRKLERFVQLSDDERTALQAVGSGRVRSFGPREDVIQEGAPPSCTRLLVSGYACRYRTLPDGRRQIVSLFVPGDFCDPHVFVLQEMDHSIATLSGARIAEVSKDEVIGLTERFPRITRAFWWDSLVTEAILREWIVSVGRRSARERVAHQFCALYVRQRAVGLTDEGECDMPLTQAELAEALGITTVHANRTLQRLRAEGLISLKSNRLVFPDFEALARTALFSTAYLHLGREGEAFDAPRRLTVPVEV